MIQNEHGEVAQSQIMQNLVAPGKERGFHPGWHEKSQKGHKQGSSMIDPCSHGVVFSSVILRNPAVPITKGNFQSFLWFSTDYKILL